MTSLYEELGARGFVAQASDPGIGQWLADNTVTVYAGFDPTADSLHLGHLVPIIALSHMQRYGHRVLIIVGGATGMIGDPGGRSEERNLLTPEEVAANVESVKAQMGKFLDFDGDNPATILNNNDWIGPMSFIDWLREVGKHFTVNYMMAKDSVKSRLGSEQGISYTEFSYMTMQSYDFLWLYDNHNCRFQVGSNDQWGNITAGIDLIRKLRRTPVYGVTFPLIKTASGEKLGKSAGNAVWLDEKRTSPWDFYQYLVRTDDRDVISFLKIFTSLPVEEINEIEAAMADAPEKREAQKTLAFEVTKIAHGQDVAQEMARAAEVVYKSEIKDLSDATLSAVFASVPATEVPWAELDAGLDVVELLAKTGMAPSKGQARRLIKSGGAYVNNVRIEEEAKLDRSNLASESFIVLRTGKKNYHLLRMQ